MKKLVIFKHSKYEWERKTLNLTHEELIEKYSSEYANVDAIIKAHDHQLLVRNFMMRCLCNATFKMMYEINKPIDKRFDLVIIVGGDNSFTKVSHYVGSMPVLGVNSDPSRSNGCMLRWSMRDENDAIEFSKMLDLHKFDVEEWPRIETTLDGNLITPATSEYYFGERLRNRMSRHILVYDGIEEEQKCSGIVIATGAGSTGWYKSICRNNIWPTTENRAAFVVSEPYSGTIFNGHIIPGKDIIIRSLNDDGGMVGVDSWQEFPFPRGTEAKITIGKKPLVVISPIQK